MNYSTPFQILIEGVVGSSYLSDIGIDDTIFSPGCAYYSSIDLPIDTSTTTTTPSPCPTPDQYRCPSGDVCIDKDKVEFIFRYVLIYLIKP